MVPGKLNTVEPRFGGNPATEVPLVEPGIPAGELMPFVTRKEVDSRIIVTHEDHQEQLAGIRASLHSPRIVQTRRRRKPSVAPDDEDCPEKPSPVSAATKKIKSIMKSTAYIGKSSKANSARDDGGFTSGFKGVTKHKATGRFEAHFWDASYERTVVENFEGRKKPRKKGKQVYLGGFETEVEAAKAYDMAAISYLGDNAHLNYERKKYAAWENGNVGKTAEQIVKEIKAMSLASRAAKRRAQKEINELNQPSELPEIHTSSEKPKREAKDMKAKPAKLRRARKRAAPKQDNTDSSWMAVAPGFESPQFLPYSETKIRRRSGGIMPVNELLLSNAIKAPSLQHGQPPNQPLAHASSHLNTCNGIHRGFASGLETETLFKSPNEQLRFRAFQKGASAPSPIPVSTALRQQFNSLPQVSLPASVGPFEACSAYETPAGNAERVSGHATVTFHASGNIKGCMETSSDQNLDVLQLSPLAKGLQLSPEFTQRGIAMSPARSGLSTPLWDLSKTEMNIAALLGTDHQSTLPPHSSPGGPRMLPMPNSILR